MSWHLLILANTVVSAVSYLIYRSLAKQGESKAPFFLINAVLYLFQYLSVLVAVPVLGPLHLHYLWDYMPWLVGGGFGFVLANLCLYKLLNHLDSGISSILGTMAIIFTIVFAGAILHERLTTSQITGTVILLSSIVYILWVARQPGSHRLSKRSWIIGSLFAVALAILSALSNINEKFLLNHMDLQSYLVFGWGFQVLVALGVLMIIRPGRSYLAKLKINQWRMIAGGIARGIAGLLFLMALVKNNSVSLTVVVSNSRIILIILLGAWLLNENNKIREKLLAASMAIISIFLIFWR